MILFSLPHHYIKHRFFAFLKKQTAFFSHLQMSPESIYLKNERVALWHG
jgi:hypothetical protein